MRPSALTAALVAVTGLAVSGASALDLSTGASPWKTLASVNRNEGRSADPETVSQSNQLFMRCDGCADWATVFARGEETLTVPLPHYDGSVTRFTLKRTTDDVISEGLQEKFPDIQTYYGRNNKGVTVELDSTLVGGVRVQFHEALGGMSYLDNVRADDPDMAMTSNNVRAAVEAKIPVFRVYQREVGKRASEALGSSDFTCATRPNKHVQKYKTSGGIPQKRKTKKDAFPELSQHASSFALLTNSTCDLSWINDTFCDPINNNPDCSFDGGDCCGDNVDKNFCDDPNSVSCSCLDPTSPFDGNGTNNGTFPTFSPTFSESNCRNEWFSDNFCDPVNNNEECQFDGGDCCVREIDTTWCDDPTAESCTCLDPDFTVEEPDVNGCLVAYSGDGLCDPANNNPTCGYDSGDCCARPLKDKYCNNEDSGACSCVDPFFLPNAQDGCINPFLGDGFCDAENNRPECQNDYLDCCGVFSDKTYCEGDNCECDAEAGFQGGAGKTYRIAIGTSPGYSAFHGNSIPSVLAEVVTAVNRIGGIYKRSLDIGFQLIDNTTSLFEFNNTGNETYFDEQGGAIDTATGIFESYLGDTEGFDIGHIFFTEDGSRAYLHSVCDDDVKANGGSGQPYPVADGFYVDYISHEIGHMFGGGHTFSGCNPGGLWPSSSVEPGSGSTIMGHAGICGPDDIQSNSDPHFSLVSLEQIQKFVLTGGSTCGIDLSKASPPKLVPKLNFPQGKCQIPSKTGFVLSPNPNTIVSSTKPDGRLSFSWEQADLAGTYRVLGVRESGPIFRSQMPIDKPVRYFPSPAAQYFNESGPGEPLEWPNRDFKFSLTVRDSWQREGAPDDAQSFLGNGRGSFAAEFVDVSVSDVGPFELAGVGKVGDTIKVDWEVSTVAALMSYKGQASQAKISFSYDFGVTFMSTTSFKFFDGSAVVPLDRPVCGTESNVTAINVTMVMVLVEVETVPGCSFYALGSMDQVELPPCYNPTATFPPTATFAPSMNGTDFLNATFAPTTLDSESDADDNSTLYTIIGSALGAIVLVAVGVFCLRQKSGGRGIMTSRTSDMSSSRYVQKEKGQAGPVSSNDGPFYVKDNFVSNVDV